MRLIIATTIAIVSTLTGTASASDGYLATGAGASLDRFLHLGVHVEGGQRLGDTLLFARGQLSSGMSGDSDETQRGTYRQARAGLEARDCLDDGWLCGFTGLDLGYGRERLMVPYADVAIAHVTGVSAVPRVGFDGGNSVRVRVSLELPIYQASTVGGGASFALGYAF